MMQTDTMHELKCRRTARFPSARGRAALKIARRVVNGEEGASLIESALSISIFLMVLFAVFDLSIAFYTYHYVSDAAREGTRYAMVRGSACSSQSHTTPCPVTSDEIASYVENLEYPGIDAGDFMTVTSTWLSQGSPSGTGNTWTACGTTAACKVHGNQVQVTVSYAFPLDIPLWKLESLSISSTSSMVISQ
jgi:hypothetical protein